MPPKASKAAAASAKVTASKARPTRATTRTKKPATDETVEAEALAPEPVAPKKRGRPTKAALAAAAKAEEQSTVEEPAKPAAKRGRKAKTAETEEVVVDAPAEAPKKRGRKPKVVAEAEAAVVETPDVTTVAVAAKTKAKRGRTATAQLAEELQDAITKSKAEESEPAPKKRGRPAKKAAELPEETKEVAPKKTVRGKAATSTTSTAAKPTTTTTKKASTKATTKSTAKTTTARSRKTATAATEEEEEDEEEPAPAKATTSRGRGRAKKTEEVAKPEPEPAEAPAPKRGRAKPTTTEEAPVVLKPVATKARRKRAAAIVEPEEAPPAKKKRGRAAKAEPTDDEPQEEAPAPAPKKKRGRTGKAETAPTVEEDEPEPAVETEVKTSKDAISTEPTSVPASSTPTVKKASKDTPKSKSKTPKATPASAVISALESKTTVLKTPATKASSKSKTPTSAISDLKADSVSKTSTPAAVPSLTKKQSRQSLSTPAATQTKTPVTASTKKSAGSRKKSIINTPIAANPSPAPPPSSGRERSQPRKRGPPENEDEEDEGPPAKRAKISPAKMPLSEATSIPGRRQTLAAKLPRTPKVAGAIAVPGTAPAKAASGAKRLSTGKKAVDIHDMENLAEVEETPAEAEASQSPAINPATPKKKKISTKPPMTVQPKPALKDDKATKRKRLSSPGPVQASRKKRVTIDESSLLMAGTPGSDGENFWLMKAEPESRIEKGVDVKFSIDDLKNASEPEPWTGVRSYAARNHMTNMKKGDLAFFYHSSCKIPGVVGIMEIVEEATVDESAFDPKDPYYDEKSSREKPKWFNVHVSFRQKLDHPENVTLTELRKHSAPGEALAEMMLFKQTRLSVSKVSKDEWNFILKLAGEVPSAESNDGHGNIDEVVAAVDEAVEGLAELVAEEVAGRQPYKRTPKKQDIDKIAESIVDQIVEQNQIADKFSLSVESVSRVVIEADIEILPHATEAMNVDLSELPDAPPLGDDSSFGYLQPFSSPRRASRPLSPFKRPSSRGSRGPSLPRENGTPVSKNFAAIPATMPRLVPRAFGLTATAGEGPLSDPAVPAAEEARDDDREPTEPIDESYYLVEKEASKHGMTFSAPELDEFESSMF